MSTRKLIIYPNPTHQISNLDENSYIPITFLKKKTQNELVEYFDYKTKAVQELSLMSNTYFSSIHYDIFLDMKLDYTMIKFFQDLSLSELETLHH